MAIPPFNEYGWLPEGVHDCTLDEVAGRFGGFHGSDRRLRLWAKFLEFVGDARACGLIAAIVVDGSFVTAEPTPNDLDLILVVPARHDFSVDFAPAAYNILSKRRVHRPLVLICWWRARTLKSTVAMWRSFNKSGPHRDVKRAW